MKAKPDTLTSCLAYAALLIACLALLVVWRGPYVLLVATQADIRALRFELHELREHVMAQPIVTTDGAKVEVRNR